MDVPCFANCFKFRAHYIIPNFFRHLIMGLFLTAFGLMLIFEGIPYFCFPNRFKEIAEKISETPDATLRTIGLFIMIAGLGLVYVGRNLYFS